MTASRIDPSTSRAVEVWERMLTQWNFTTRGRPYPPGRDDVPYALLDLHESWMFDEEDDCDRTLLAVAIEDAWTSAEFPSLALSTNTWTALFSEVGFLRNKRRAQAPATVPTLYRAAVHDVPGLSWTEDVDLAMWFHERNLGWNLPATFLERNDVASDEVLAHFHDEQGRAEHEWVLRDSGDVGAQNNRLAASE